MQEVIFFYNGLEVPTRQILDSNGAITSKTAADAKVAIPEMAQLNNLGREIKKVNETVYATQVGCEQCKGPHYTKDFPLKEEKKTLKEAYYTQFVKRYEENSNLIKEIRALTDAAIRNQGASIKTLEIQIEQISKSISTTVKADTNSIRHIGSSQYAVSTLQNSTLMYEPRQMTILFPCHLNDYYCEERRGSYRPEFSEAYSYGASYIDNSIPRKEKDLGSFTLPCYINDVCFNNALADLGASVSVMPLWTNLNLGLGELPHTKLIVELVDRTVKYPKGIAENVLIVLRRHQVDDLIPTIEEGEVIEEFRTGNDARMISKIFRYPSLDIAKISRKRSKPDNHGHGNGIKYAKARRMLSKVNKSQPLVNQSQHTKRQNPNFPK
ncbi:reverse transcriptase domain-containing protein [Tanacetum coccineum]